MVKGGESGGSGGRWWKVVLEFLTSFFFAFFVLFVLLCVLCCFLVSEKWHDQNAAQDVVWVNQTFWMESELDLLDNVWETSEKASHFYNQQTKSSASQKER